MKQIINKLICNFNVYFDLPLTERRIKRFDLQRTKDGYMYSICDWEVIIEFEEMLQLKTCKKLKILVDTLTPGNLFKTFHKDEIPKRGMN